MWLMLSLAVASSPLPPLPGPLGHIGGVVAPAPGDGAPDPQHGVVFQHAPSCPLQVVAYTRMLAGTVRAAEQMQAWLEPLKLERQLFGSTKGTLAGVVGRVRTAKYVPRAPRQRPPLVDGAKLHYRKAPTLLAVALSGPAQEGEAWFVDERGRPVGVIHLAPGSTDVCRPRLSAVLFDVRGFARLRLHADWGGEVSAELVGDGGKEISFAFNRETQGFSAMHRSGVKQ